MLNIIIWGAPGCGKGTQSALIVEKFKLKHLSTGDLLRSEIQSNSELGKEADSYISKGNLVPDSMIINILHKAIDAEVEGKGIILDGFPRTVAQAEALETMLAERNRQIDFFLNIEVEKRELIARLLKRGETSGRSDDNLETIQKRLEVYEVKTAPVNDFYKQKGKLQPINGMGTVEEIFDRVSAVLESKK
ncbi:MAG: adenylate kinase [Paludibacter sp.]|jgi:adenylate kinase|nr:adenylate kinase [Paludibacter sp.]